MGLSATKIEDARFEGTGYSYTMSLIQGKYKMAILYCLMEYQPVRFNQMRRYLGKVTDRTLSTNLKELEADGLVKRKEYPQIPPKVEYSLTQTGRSLLPILTAMRDWGADYLRRKDTEPCCFMMGTNPIVKPTNR